MRLFETEYPWLRSLIADMGEAVGIIQECWIGRLNRASADAALVQLKQKPGLIRRYPRLHECYEGLQEAISRAFNAEGHEREEAMRVLNRRFRRLVEIGEELVESGFDPSEG